MRYLAIFGLFLVLLAPRPVAAQAAKSFCNIERLGTAELVAMAKVYGENEDPPESFIQQVLEIDKVCAQQVGTAAAATNDFGLFVFAEVMTYSHRALLAERGYDMDAFDNALNLSCNFDNFPVTGTPTAQGKVLLEKALLAGKVVSEDVPQPVIEALATYIVAAPDRWRRGSKLALLPLCGAKG